MIIGVPREIKTAENRVALVPAGVEALVGDGHTVLVEAGAGIGSGFGDETYRAVGGTLVPKVLDFGIAKAANQVEMTRAGEIKGKLSYMSPEQCMGKPLDHRSDIFSLGVVLYEWVTGFKLFTGESDVAVLKSITDGKIYRPSYFKADVPEAVETILMRALEKDAGARYQSAWEMQYDLDKFLANNEFTPSNQHLATFMKQLFADQMDAERARIALMKSLIRLQVATRARIRS